MAENVNITVRCAFQSGTDIHVDCPTTWTVKDLKEHLHTVCSLHPAVASQRLIYAGACLADQMTIEAVLARRKFDDQLVFHLVCPMPQVAPEIRQRNTAGGTQGTLPNSCNIPTRSANQMGSPITPTSPQDYAQAYQAYYQWYMHSYMNMMATTHGTPAAFAPTWDQNAGVNMPTFWGNLGNQPLNQPQPAAPAPQENDVAARPANFVQGEEELEARGGDILDLLYRCFRIVLFVSVVWLYSSIERFLVVFCIGLGIYFLKLRRDQRAAAAAANPTTPPVNNNNTGEPMANNPDMPEVEIPQPNSRQLFLSTCYSFVTSFFTSLVPDNPVPANLN